MMRKSVFIYAVLLAVLVTSVLQAQDSQFLSKEQAGKIDELFLRFNNSTPGAAVGILKDGEFVYKRGFGMADLEHDIPVTSKSVFQIASISKQFTTMSIVLLHLEGKLNIDDDIRKYLPEVPDFDHLITIRHLCNHLSGLREVGDLLRFSGWRRRDITMKEDILNLVTMQKELNFEPGEEYLYNNTAYVLLSYIVERVSEQSLAEFTRERIFEPLGMHATFVRDDMSKVIKNLAHAYYPKGKGEYGWSIPNSESYGSTAVHTTLDDFAKWEQNFRHKKVGGEEGIELMLTKGVFNSGEENYYALGIWHETYRGLDNVAHTGSHAGYRANFTMWPDEGVSFIIFGNTTEIDRRLLPKLMADIVFEGKLGPMEEAPPFENTSPDPPELDIKRLRQYSGDYYCPELDYKFKIVVEDGSLYVVRKKLGKVKLMARDIDLFAMQGAAFKFVRGQRNRVIEALFSTGRARNVRMIRN